MTFLTNETAPPLIVGNIRVRLLPIFSLNHCCLFFLLGFFLCCSLLFLRFSPVNFNLFPFLNFPLCRFFFFGFFLCSRLLLCLFPSNFSLFLLFSVPPRRFFFFGSFPH